MPWFEGRMNCAAWQAPSPVWLTDRVSQVNPTAALIAAVSAIIVGVLAASVLLYSKRLERINATEVRHSASREAAYNKLLAAGDAAWYYRTLAGVEADASETDSELMGPVASGLFQSGFDELEAYSRNLTEVGPVIVNWYMVAFEHRLISPTDFDNAREALVNLKRQEIGLRRNIDKLREASFYDQLAAGHVVQRLPEGVGRVIRFEDGGFLAQCTGDGFVRLFEDMINAPKALRGSRQTARQRLSDWRAQGVWKAEPTDLERTDEPT